MKKDGKYRFTLGFGSDTEEEYRAGEVVAKIQCCTKQELSPFGGIAIRKTK